MDIVLRATVIYFFLWLLLRALGKRELAEMSPFELVLLMTMGDFVQQGVTQEDFSVTGAMLAVGTISLWILTASFVAYKWKNVQTIVEGLPAVIIHNGRLSKEAMKAERLTEEEVLDACREQGITALSHIRYGILEADGKFSFLKADGSEPPPNQQNIKA